MIVEERIYVLHTEVKKAEFLSIYEKEGLSVQIPILGGFLGYFTSEIGTLNQMVHLWAYDNLEERRQRRDLLAASAQWQGCLEKIRPMIRTMENRILLPTSFSHIRDMRAAGALANLHSQAGQVSE